MQTRTKEYKRKADERELERGAWESKRVARDKRRVYEEVVDCMGVEEEGELDEDLAGWLDDRFVVGNERHLAQLKLLVLSADKVMADQTAELNNLRNVIKDIRAVFKKE